MREQRLQRALDVRADEAQAALPDRGETYEAEADHEQAQTEVTKRWEHTKANLHAKVEHPFRVIKRQFGHVKVRNRGLAKNITQLLTLFELSNP